MTTARIDSPAPALSTAPAVRIDGVSKRFGAGPVVLDDISLDFAPGEVGCLLGPAGFGQSTLVNLIAVPDRASEHTASVMRTLLR